MWSNIKGENFWGEDQAFLGELLPFEKPNGDMTFDITQGRWDDGVLRWNIQWGWRERNSDIEDIPVKTISERYDQTFTIDQDGTLSV